MKRALTINCPACSEKLEARMTRKAKPYFLCTPCGIQIFFRLQEGIDRLKGGRGKAEEVRGHR